MVTSLSFALLGDVMLSSSFLYLLVGRFKCNGKKLISFYEPKSFQYITSEAVRSHFMS